METSRAPRPGEIVGGCEVVREIASWAGAVYLARDAAKGLVTLHVIDGDDAKAMASDARTYARITHPSVAQVREVVEAPGRVVLVSEVVRGEPLPGIRGSLPLGGALRVLVDVLAGLGALHATPGGARGARIHGEVAPPSVLVGVDGVARLGHPIRPKGRKPREDTIGYLAPETLLEDDCADARADVYAVGAMLWEALTGRRLHTTVDAGQIVVRLLGGKIERPAPPKDAAWADPLGDLAWRAIRPEPASRPATAAEMSAEISRVAGSNVWAASAVGAFVEERAGGRIRARFAGGEAAKATSASAPSDKPAIAATPIKSPPATKPMAAPPPASPRVTPPAPPVAATPLNPINVTLQSARSPAPSRPTPPALAPNRISALPTPIVPVAPFPIAVLTPPVASRPPPLPPPKTAPAASAPSAVAESRALTPVAAPSRATPPPPPAAPVSPLPIARAHDSGRADVLEALAITTRWSPERLPPSLRRGIAVGAGVALLLGGIAVVALGRLSAAPSARAPTAVDVGSRAPAAMAPAEPPNAAPESTPETTPAPTLAAVPDAGALVAAPPSSGEPEPTAKPPSSETPPAAHATPSAEPVAPPPPLRKKRPAAYYPLGI